MRCPKCHYISFEDGDRCRNCGYDYSLAPGVESEPELALNDRDEDPLPPMDLSLSQVDGSQERSEARVTPFDLPLFTGGDPDAPLIKAPAAPRPPLAVRRPSPDTGRVNPRLAAASAPRVERSKSPPLLDERAERPPAAQAALPAGDAPAPAGRRLLAAAIDLLILGTINAGVLYFTLKLCALPLTLEGLGALPVAPMAAFLLLIDAGYAASFTAAIGQTIGKMATGLHVVHLREDGGGPEFGFAIVRTAACIASVLPAGLGFLPALFASDRRALHDRLADTRVITR